MCAVHVFVCIDFCFDKKKLTTSDSGSLGLCIDEERSKLQYVVYVCTSVYAYTYMCMHHKASQTVTQKPKTGDLRVSVCLECMRVCVNDTCVVCVHA